MRDGKERHPRFVGVTGGQGVGKSTFCAKLVSELSFSVKNDVVLIDGLGKRIKQLGIPFGSTASQESIISIYIAHLERQRKASGDIVILDRCAVDALAYVRCLRRTDSHISQLLEEISKYMIKDLELVVHLRMDGRFAATAATHETPELRQAVAEEVQNILSSTDVECVSAIADDAAILERVISRVIS